MKTLDLLNSEGPIITAEWRGYEIYVVHRVHGFSKRVTRTELESMVKGLLTLKIPIISPVDGMYDLEIGLTSFPRDMQCTWEGLQRFIEQRAPKALVYVASPYTHPDPEVVQARYEQVSRLTARLVAEGEAAVSPITYGHHLLDFHTMPTDWEFWMDFCIALLSKCDRMLVAKIPGWEESRGVQAEIRYAQDHGIPVEYIEA
jgi:hypothetical protein